MKKILALALSLTMAAGLLAGCGSDNTSTSKTEDDNAKTETTSLSGTVNTDGSTSMEKVVKYLSESFQDENTGVTINYSGTGSGTGIEAVLAGTCDIGLSSRELKDEEEAEGAVAHIVALDGVAIIVNPENGVEDLTVEEIAKLATGEIKDWSELGGTAGPVAFIGREAGSGTRGAFEEIVGVEDECVYTNELTSTGDVITNVASNPNAIGYASLSAVNDTVKALKVEGVECTEATVQDGTYAIQRPFVMVTKDGTTLSKEAQAFLDYATSADVADLITEAGAVSPK
ncbi:MAG: phosphate ABC transporter substrate-binding protein PstS family protein [Oscillospiraceae bacterium]|jgi:phosphate transport system substrate-binding protein